MKKYQIGLYFKIEPFREIRLTCICANRLGQTCVDYINHLAVGQLVRWSVGPLVRQSVGLLIHWLVCEQTPKYSPEV